MKPVRRNLPQLFLREERYFPPDIRIVEAIQIDALESVAKERRAQGELHRAALSFALDLHDLGFRNRPLQSHATFLGQLARLTGALIRAPPGKVDRNAIS
jgi:hypothetical protein